MVQVLYELVNGLESKWIICIIILYIYIFCIRLIINEGLEIGSQIAYIRRARAAGYAVIVTNTNLNDYESSRLLRRSSTRPIRVNLFLLDI